MSISNSDPGLSVSRLASLTDGIFAFSMTLLVITINMPTNIPKPQAGGAIWEHLIQLIPQLLIYIMAFITLGAFWYGHERQFHLLKLVDGKLLWINITGMMLIALIPFTTDLAGDYGYVQTGILPLEINLLLINLVFYAQWAYITSRPRLLNIELEPLKIKRSRERHAILIGISMLAIALSFVSPELSPLPYLVMPFLFISKRYHLFK